MIESILRRFVTSKQRNRAVIIVTVLTALVVVWPAADEYSAARGRTREALARLEETQGRISQLSLHQQVQQKKQYELESLERRTLSERAALELQGTLTELGRETGCTVRKARLSEVTRRDWREGDDPLAASRTAAAGEDTPFQLESRTLTLSVTGPMIGLYRFLEGLHRVDKVMHSKTATIKRAGEESGTGSLDVELLLFDLPRKPTES